MGTVVGGEGHGSCKPKGTPQNYKRTHVNIFANVERERERERKRVKLIVKLILKANLDTCHVLAFLELEKQAKITNYVIY